MRRSSALLLVISLLVLAGCGSSSSGGPQGTEYSYFPASSPFILSIQTDPQSTAVKNGQALIGRFPIVTLGETALMSRLQQLGVNYQTDIKPLFGNPASIGAAASNISGSARSAFLLVWVTKDAGKLAALVKKGGVRSAGSHDGVALFQSNGGTTALAIDGATLILGPSTSLVSAALDRHAHGGGFSNDQASKDLSGLPKDSLIQAVGNLTGALSGPRAAKARRVPWVEAIRGYGTSVSANSSGLSFSYRVDTSGGKLSSSQLPLASGGSAPSYAGGGPIQLALNNPSQLVTFIEGAAQTANPASYARFQAQQAALRARRGVDLNTLLTQLTGGLALTSDTRTTVARVGVRDPGAASNALSKLAGQKNVFNNGPGLASIGGGFYTLKQRKPVNLGVVGNQLVLGRATVPELRAFAAAPATAATGAQGSLAFRVSVTQLLQLAIKRTPPRAAQAILGALGDYTGWVGATSNALTGNASLSLK